MSIGRKLTWADVAAFRLGRHHLGDTRPGGRERDKPADARAAELVRVCREVCGIQAQVMSAAHLALWARVRRVTPAEIHRVLCEERTLVRTSCMRQTLHLLPTTDFSLYITALRASRLAAVRRIMSKFGVTREEEEALNATILAGLGGGPRSQRDLREHVKPLAAKNVRAWMERVWSPFRTAIHAGLVCYGPLRGAEITLVRTDEWLPKQKAVSEAPAKQIVLRRYLGAYGPATVRDFSHWSGMPMSEARPVWAGVQDELAEVDVEGWRAWLLKKDVGQLLKNRSRKPILRLLPSFDPYLLAHADKGHMLNAKHYKSVFRNSAWISPVILLDGSVIGVWSHKRKGSSVLMVEATPFEKATTSVRALVEEEAAGLEQFFGARVEVTFSRIVGRR